MKKRNLLVAVGLIVGMMTLSACGSGEPSTNQAVENGSVANESSTVSIDENSDTNNANAESTYTFELGDKNPDENTASLKDVEYSSEDAMIDTIEVPSEVDGYKIVGIGGAFGHEKNVRKVVVNSESVTEIVDRAFMADADATTQEYYSSIEEIDLYGITSIGKEAFYGCSELKKVVLGDGLVELGETAFFLCDNLEEVHIPASVNADFSEVFSSQIVDQHPFTIYTPAGSAAESFGNEYDFITVINE